MIAEIGHFALVLALLLALVQGTVPLWGAGRGDGALMALARPAASAQFLFIAVAFLALMQGYVVSDFSIANVAENSHTAKPLLYKISGVWGNHEGSMVLWVLILSLFGAAIAAFGGNLPAELRARVLAIQGLIGAGFLLFMLFTSNPFARIVPPPLEGRGLNPLLQDPGLAFHPPFLYLGYVGFSVAFSFAIAALIEGRVDPAWARWVRPWTLAAWCFLTIGVALGSWWAYYELGWGGWWFWDPVENASFMPWLAGTALLHTAIVVEKRGSLKSWTILLAIVTFSLSLLGTFLVRSGVLSSVHAFAVDPARGTFILAFLVLVVGGSLVLFAVRAPALKATGLFAPISREGGLVLNNLLLTSATATVFLGTMYPLFLDALTGEKVSVGAPYFNATFGPIMVPLIAAMAVGPMLPWKRADLAGALARLQFAFAAAVVVALITWYLAAGGPVLAILGMGLAAWVSVGALVELTDRAQAIPRPAHRKLAEGAPLAAFGLRHGARPWRARSRPHGHRRFHRLANRAPPDHAAGRDGEPSRVPVYLRGDALTDGAQLHGAARPLPRQPRRRRRRRTRRRDAHLSDTADADHRGSDPADADSRSLCRRRRTRRRRRLRDPALSQATGALDLVRHPDNGDGRLGLAFGPSPPRWRAGAPAVAGDHARAHR